MCGIAGFISKNEFPDNAQEIITRMTSTLKHRGPDKQDVYLSPNVKSALGHTRLSIIDLSETGNQPMVSPCDRYSLVFNGEIYNYKALREELISEGELFKGASDTEVLFKALITWGIEAALNKLNGMFAFAFLDNEEKELFIARDRIGIKPVYYGYSNKNFIFGSELKAIKAHPVFNNSVSNDAIALFMRHNTIPAPWSIYENIFQLRAGCYLRFSIKRFEITRLRHYWELHDVAQKGVKNHYSSPVKAVEQLEHTLSESVKMRMQADVPYGAFLSGGIDSSLIVSLMQKHSTEKIKTFSIGFEQKNFNESIEAQRVADHLKTDHHSMVFTSQNAIDLIPDLCNYYDQPFADSSQLPTFLVSKMAREQVKVCLSGDGGDELFAGYDRYLWGKKALRWHKQFSPPTRYLMANTLRSLSPGTWDILAKALFFIPAFRSKRMGEKIYKLAKVLKAVNRFGLYKSLSSVWLDPDEVMLKSSEPLTALTDEDNWLAQNDFIK
ncbi:MAG: asparagine synthase (glutamine-hydrolyzing), partial [Lentisphaeraceae bacterium]|nr:asparagine synthase (glutamine-hydrolyzing) [Lentisphaeraceae bacterium]